MRELLAAIEEAAGKATLVKPVDLMRYEHGGARLAILRDGMRHLVADFYHTEDTEFYALTNPSNIAQIVAYVKALESLLGECRKQVQTIVDDGTPTDWQAWLDDLNAALAGDAK